MESKHSPEAVKEQYERAVSYNAAIDLYNTVKQNENFFIGNQWEGVNAPDLDKPVINILKRVILFFVASIVSDDISTEISQFGGDHEGDNTLLLVREEVDRIIEAQKLKDKNRLLIRNAAVDGDACLYLRFDPDAESIGPTDGDIAAEIIDNTNVFFGNPEVDEIQSQPYVILMLRRDLESLKEELKADGAEESLLLSLRPDDDPNGMNREREEGKVTVLVKFWKERETGTVWVTKTANDVCLMPPTDTGYKLYPVAYMSWDKIKNRYHGQAAVTGLIPNQIFVNKLFAMAMEQVKKMAFPKIIYNRSLFPNGFNNRVGEAVGAAGDPTSAVMQNVRPADMSGQVMELVEKTISYTRDMMGASDASLGNIRPENTSAIIAVQKSSSMPLELNRMSFYQFVEDYIRIMVDIMRVNFGMRYVMAKDEDGVLQRQQFDFSTLQDMKLQLNVSVGAAAYWSELMQMQTTDNLFAKGIITDAVTYLESIPDEYIKNKSSIIEDLKRAQLPEPTPTPTGNGADLAAMMGGNLNALPKM